MYIQIILFSNVVLISGDKVISYHSIYITVAISYIFNQGDIIDSLKTLFNEVWL